MAGRRCPKAYARKRAAIYRAIEREHAQSTDAIGRRLDAILRDAEAGKDALGDARTRGNP